MRVKQRTREPISVDFLKDRQVGPTITCLWHCIVWSPRSSSDDPHNVMEEPKEPSYGQEKTMQALFANPTPAGASLNS
jgi:hypothetical protein